MGRHEEGRPFRPRLLAESIREPGVFRSPAFRSEDAPVDAMPLLGLNDAEIDAIVRYLLAAE